MSELYLRQITPTPQFFQVVSHVSPARQHCCLEALFQEFVEIAWSADGKKAGKR
jgi:hypothetical protein